jgi:cellulose synthase/poly-beta-1,6-N-acetylglucosamine synthase-like glycosyltransferase
LFNIKFFFNNIIFIISYLNKQIEYYNIQKLLLLYNNNKEIIKKYERINIPKISIISPIYNSEKYILRFMKSIRNQNFIDIEIILVDDCSIDNSVSKIEKYAIEDERIILIKNKRNKGTFVTRNIGVLFSKGKYIFNKAIIIKILEFRVMIHI